MKCKREMLRLYAVTDRSWLRGRTLKEQVEEALRGGATCIQLREKEMDEEEFLAEAVEMKRLCERYRTPFIINDNVRIALACGADGVHVGQTDMETGAVRALLGEDKIIGVSAQTVEQALAAEAAGADYLGVGAVFPTTTKTDAREVPRRMLKDICSSVKIPVVAIGGIHRENIMQLSRTGAVGVALVSAVFAAERIEEECRELRRLSERMAEG